MKTCFNCKNKGSNMYGYTICDTCKSKLKLFTDQTIEKYHSKDPKKFAEDIQKRLDFLDKDYIKKRIKLLHI